VTGAPPRAAVTLGSRLSKLALAQTARAVELLQAASPELGCRIEHIVTEGDRTQASGAPLPEIGGKGLFTAALEEALRAGSIDIAVHSLKDLPTEEPSGLVVGAVCLRDDPRDCLVSRDGLGLGELRPGAVIGTSSLRRSAQLRGMRHDVEVRSLRGNVDTRLRKVAEGEVDAVVLAAAGIRRLAREDEVTHWFDPEEMVPAPGQGALALQCRADDPETRGLLAAVDDTGARAEGIAERAFLRMLEAGCTAPVGAFARVRAIHEVSLVGLVSSVDGRDVVRVEGEGEPEEVGERLAQEALAAGAHQILEAIRA
jgi:hydroxymethylbilane synthase